MNRVINFFLKQLIEKLKDTEFNNVKQVKLLVLTHGEVGNKFWDEFDMAFTNLQRFYGFKLYIKRFGQSGVEKQLEFLNQFENQLWIQNLTLQTSL